MSKNKSTNDKELCSVCGRPVEECIDQSSRVLRLKTRHAQKLIQVGYRKAHVDEGIAPLIKELWKADIDTLLSCQENQPGIIWVEFMSASDAEQFLSIVADKYDPDPAGLYNRIVQDWEKPEKSLPAWRYNGCLMDLNARQIQEEDGVCSDEVFDGKPDILFSFSVRFPVADYPVILKRMRRHNVQKRGGKARARKPKASAA